MNLQATSQVPKVKVVEVEGVFTVYTLEGFFYNDPDWYEPVFKSVASFESAAAAGEAAAALAVASQNEGSQA